MRCAQAAINNLLKSTSRACSHIPRATGAVVLWPLRLPGRRADGCHARRGREAGGELRQVTGILGHACCVCVGGEGGSMEAKSCSCKYATGQAATPEVRCNPGCALYCDTHLRTCTATHTTLHTTTACTPRSTSLADVCWPQLSGSTPQLSKPAHTTQHAQHTTHCLHPRQHLTRRCCVGRGPDGLGGPAAG